MVDHTKTLDQVVNAVKAMLPQKTAADKVLREIQRQEAKEAAQPSVTTNGETEPEE